MEFNIFSKTAGIIMAVSGAHELANEESLASIPTPRPLPRSTISYSATTGSDVGISTWSLSFSNSDSSVATFPSHEPWQQAWNETLRNTKEKENIASTGVQSMLLSGAHISSPRQSFVSSDSLVSLVEMHSRALLKAKENVDLSYRTEPWGNKDIRMLMTLTLFDCTEALTQNIETLPVLPAKHGRYLRIKRSMVEWAYAFDVACSRACTGVLQCMLRRLLPQYTVPESGHAGNNLLHTLAALEQGWLCRQSDLKAALDSRAYEILQSHFGNGRLLTSRDDKGRTPLHWAVISCNSSMINFLLRSASAEDKEDLVNGVDRRMQTPLHYACSRNFLDPAKLLIEAGASVNAQSRRLWTPLHLVCMCKTDPVRLSKLLLENNADVNARLQNRRTPLHLAARSGHRGLVRLLRLKLGDRQQLHPKDIFSSTPAILAGQLEISTEFAPWQRDENWYPVPDLCRSLCATVCEWSSSGKRSTHKLSIHDLLYKESNRTITQFLPHGTVRWIHIPANNIEWCDELLTRWFTEGAGIRDTEGWKIARQAFDQQHAATTTQGRFLRPSVLIAEPNNDTRDRPPSTSLGRRPSSSDDSYTSGQKANDIASGGRRPTEFDSCTSSEIHTVKTGSSPDSEASLHSARYMKTQQGSKQRHMFMSAPYVHFERLSKVKRMKNLLHSPSLENVQFDSVDERLYSAYVKDSGFHPRRTLDQYIYHNLSTEDRDEDQVIQRHQKRNQASSSHNYSHDATKSETITSTNPAEQADLITMMVDQLWIWTLGEHLVVTCFPQRWGVADEDPHGILEGLKESISSASIEVPTAIDFALRAMAHCFGKFDRHAQNEPYLQFMNVFEQSIGEIGQLESRLLKTFAESYKALKSRSGNGGSNKVSSGADHAMLAFAEKLDDLTHETDLLVELKDIRDELSILHSIFRDQREIADWITNIQVKLSEKKSPPLSKSIRPALATRKELDTVAGPLYVVIDEALQDVARMDAQAARFSRSLSELLELKQAHSNAFELEFSRSLSLGAQTLSLDAAKQGRAVLIFTIVTIVFSPLSFIAAFFTMDLTNLPHDDDGVLTLSLSHVSKYVFGLGLAIIVPCIALAFTTSEVLAVLTNLWSSIARIREMAARRQFGSSSPTADFHQGNSLSKELDAAATKSDENIVSPVLPLQKDSTGMESPAAHGLSNGQQDLSSTSRGFWRKRQFTRTANGMVLPR